MTSVVGFELAQVRPPEDELLQAQGIPGDSALPERVRATPDTAYELFHELAAPVGLLEELPREEFAAIYAGDGRNAPDSPLSHIVPRAEGLALYAATVGSNRVESGPPRTSPPPGHPRWREHRCLPASRDPVP